MVFAHIFKALNSAYPENNNQLLKLMANGKSMIIILSFKLLFQID